MLISVLTHSSLRLKWIARLFGGLSSPMLFLLSLYCSSIVPLVFSLSLSRSLWETHSKRMCPKVVLPWRKKCPFQRRVYHVQTNPNNRYKKRLPQSNDITRKWHTNVRFFVFLTVYLTAQKKSTLFSLFHTVLCNKYIDAYSRRFATPMKSQPNRWRCVREEGQKKKYIIFILSETLKSSNLW